MHSKTQNKVLLIFSQKLRSTNNFHQHWSWQRISRPQLQKPFNYVGCSNYYYYLLLLLLLLLLYIPSTCAMMQCNNWAHSLGLRLAPGRSLLILMDSTFVRIWDVPSRSIFCSSCILMLLLIIIIITITITIIIWK